jgi:ATP-binding cassette subfamily F protein 3
LALITLTDASFDYTREPILAGAELRLHPGERVALVGPNGAGKSTLLAILAGDLDLLEGRREARNNLRLRWLRQETTFDPAEWAGRTVRGMVAEAAFPEVLELEAELERVGAEIGGAAGEAAEELGREHGRLQSEFERRDGYTWRSRLEAALSGLGVPTKLWDREPGVMSGGERRRAALAAALLANADLLMLDEPTNHLDLQAREWLESHLARYGGALVVVSHDRYFLDRSCDRTVELRNARLTTWRGNYSSWVKEAAERRVRDMAAWKRQQESIARTEAFIRKNIEGQKTNAAKSRRKQLAHVERLERPDAEAREWRIELAQSRPSGANVLEVEGLTKGFDGGPLFADVATLVARGERMGIVGPNGCGKSTLLKTLAGEILPDRGRVSWGHNVDLGVYDQQLRRVSDDNTVIEELSDAWPGATLGELRSFAGAFGFGADMIDRPVGALSGGERARIALMRLMREGHNTLLLDEPTNHLDAATCEALEDALRDYDGTLVVVSHDRRFLERVATRLMVFEDDDVVQYMGTWSEYAVKARERREALSRARRDAAPAPAVKPAAKPEGLSKNERRRRVEWIAEVEVKIEALEEEKDAVLASMADPGLSPEARVEAGRRIAAVEAELAEHLAQWEAWSDEIS